MSGRPRSIDRDKVLDAAEAIVTEHGAAGLSFGAVAKAAGITRGGVQYCFGTRENLIRAMLDRWAEHFEAEVMAGLGPDPDREEVLLRHIHANLAAPAAEFARSAVMMTAVLQSPDQVAETRAWYNERLQGLDLTEAKDRRTAIAFLAGEGVFFLRSFGLLDLEDSAWQALFADIVRLADPDSRPQDPPKYPPEKPPQG